MGVVKLPSGKTARVPDGLNEQEVAELLFSSLPDGDDKDAFGNMLETSGWGSAIGGTLGGIGGAIAGSFAGPLGTVAGGVGGSGAGSAAGEAFEQWLTGGRGTGTDVVGAGAEGAAWGLVPGVGGAAVKGVGKYGAGKLLQSAAGLGGTTAAGAGLGAGSAAVTGQDARIGAGIGAAGGLFAGNKLAGQFLSDPKVSANIAELAKDRLLSYFTKAKGLVVNKTSAVDLPDSMLANIEDIVMGTVRSKLGRPTGRFQVSKGLLDMRRDLLGVAFSSAVQAFGKLTRKQQDQIEKSVDKVIARFRTEWDEFDAGKANFDAIDPKAQGELFPEVAEAIAKDETAGLGASFKAEGGPITEAEGWAAESAKYAKDTISNVTPRQILEFVPVVGDILGAEEVYREINKPNPNWYLIGALTAGTIVGLVPGVGDAAGAAIKAGARSVGKGAKAVGNVIEGTAKGLDTANVARSSSNLRRPQTPSDVAWEARTGVKYKPRGPLGPTTPEGQAFLDSTEGHTPWTYGNQSVIPDAKVSSPTHTTPASRRDTAAARADAQRQSLNDKFAEGKANWRGGQLVADGAEDASFHTQRNSDLIRRQDNDGINPFSVEPQGIVRSSRTATDPNALIKETDLQTGPYDYDGAKGLTAHVPTAWKGKEGDFLQLPEKERIIERWKAEGSPRWSLDKALSDADSHVQARIFTDMTHNAVGDIDYEGSIIRQPIAGGTGNASFVSTPPEGATIATRRHETGHAIDFAIRGGDSPTRSVPENVLAELDGIVTAARGNLRGIHIYDQEAKAQLKEFPLEQRSKVRKFQEAKRKELLGQSKAKQRETALESYSPDQYPEELIADAFQLIGENPKRFKSIAPNTFKFIKEHVDSVDYVRSILNAQTGQGVPLKNVVGSLVALGATATVINQAIGHDAVKGGKGIVA